MRSTAFLHLFHFKRKYILDGKNKLCIITIYGLLGRDDTQNIVVICFTVRKKGDAMIQSTAFDYINVLDKAADASWLRETVIANNISNADTPGYKRRDVDFETLLKHQLAKADRFDSLDKKIKETELPLITATAHIDAASYPYDYRLDGNNVDIQTENVELASEQIRYQVIANSISDEFTAIKAAMSK